MAETQTTGLAGDYVRGLAASFEGLRFLCARPTLWRFAVWPILINIVVSLAALYLAYQLFGYLSQSYADSLPIGLIATIKKWMAFFAALVAAFSTAFVVYVLLQSVFCAWFFSLLARQVELFLGTARNELSDPPIVAQISDALRAAIKLLIVNLFVLLLNLIPVAGSVAALVIGVYVDAFILGSEFFGYPLELRGIRWRDRQRIAKTHLGVTLGLGTVVSLLFLIPILGPAIQATSVVGAVLLFRRINGLPTTRAEAGLDSV
ncbi:hypothetical protein GC176_13185 [bacterium]|nr:hypothetical protein [bacterium]